VKIEKMKKGNMVKRPIELERLNNEAIHKDSMICQKKPFHAKSFFSKSNVGKSFLSVSPRIVFKIELGQSFLTA
jgi:hypothetical protein